MPTTRIDSAHSKPPRVYLECYETATNRLKTGIQRVVRNLILHHPTAAHTLGIEAMPVRFVGDDVYPFSWRPTDDSNEPKSRQAWRGWLARLIGDIEAERWSSRVNIVTSRLRKALRFRKLRRQILAQWLGRFGQPVRPQPGDTLVLVDATWGLNIWPAVQRWRALGGKVAFLIYDILPVTHPQFWSGGTPQRFSAWFAQLVDNSDLILTISQTVRDQVRDIVRHHDYAPGVARPVVEAFPLGAELDMRHATAGVRATVRSALSAAAGPAPYVMVGTIEPRKNHHTVLDAFDQLWRRGRDARLVIVGRRGWDCKDLERRIWSHPRFGTQLFWFADLSDSELHEVYQQARAIVFASLGEGFGLPIVEGLQFGKPVIASDLPVHREVAGKHAAYFHPQRPEELTAWIELYDSLGFLPGVASPSDYRAVTWLEGTTELLRRCRDAFLPPPLDDPPDDQRKETERHEGGGQLGCHDPAPALLGERVE